MKVKVTKEGKTNVSLQPVAIEIVTVEFGQEIEAVKAKDLHLCKTLLSLGFADEVKEGVTAKVEPVVENKMDSTVNNTVADEAVSEAPKKRTRKKKAAE